MYSNHLHGSVPSELGMVSQLNILDLFENHLTGRISFSLSNCTNIKVLSIFFNLLLERKKLFSTSTRLKIVYGTNYFFLCLMYSAIFLSKLCSKKTTQLKVLYLGGNLLSGNIPSSLFNCTKIHIIGLSGNQLSGIVPMELDKLMHL